MARPELTERRPAWPVTLRLEPLGDEEVDVLIAERVPPQLRDQVARAAGGNPLFVEEMLAMAGEATGEVVVPPSLQAVLAARLDQLEPAERSVLERGAVEGEIFHRGAVQALSHDTAQVTPRLAALVRKRLIRPDRPQLAGEDGFRFCHLLIRDAAYNSLPKATRADFHERFAAWLAQHDASLVEQDELFGYHLEQACLYRSELGIPDDDGAVAGAARQRLTAGGRRAASRQDYGAALSLFERAAALAPPDELDLALALELGDALFWTGRGADALRRANDFAERAAAAGDRVGELCGRILGEQWRVELEMGSDEQKLAELVEQAMPVFRAAEDELALYVAYTGLSYLADARSQSDADLEAYEQAVIHARRAGHHPTGLVGTRAACRFFGTTPVSELLAWLDENEPSVGRDHFLRAYRAGALAMIGRFDEARAILAETRAELADRGAAVLLANIIAFESVWVELWAGDPAAAVEFGSEGWRLHQAHGGAGRLPLASGYLAQAYYALDRLDDAAVWAARAAELDSPSSAWARMLWRQARAKVLARRAEHAEAEALAREAVAIGETTDMLNMQGDAHADLAEVLQLGGKSDEAASVLEDALERYQRKGNLVSAQRTRTRLAGLQHSALP